MLHFVTQLAWALANGAPSRWFSLSSEVLNTALLSGTTKCSKITLYFPCLHPDISHFSREFGFLVRRKEFTNYALGIGCAHYYKGISAVRPSVDRASRTHSDLYSFLSQSHALSSNSPVQLLSHVRLFATPLTAAHQASLSITNPWSLLKLMSIESEMPSNHLIICFPLLLPPSIFPSIRVFSNELVLCIRWPKYWSFSFTLVLPVNIQDWFPLGWTGWISLQSKGLSRVFSNTTVQKHQFFSTQLSL